MQKTTTYQVNYAVSTTSELLHITHASDELIEQKYTYMPLIFTEPHHT